MDQATGSSAFTVGSLVYGRRALISVFFWMLFANLALQLMEWLPTLIPIQLRRLGAGDVLIGFTKDSLAALITVLFNPALAAWSDRHRGRLGRRLPFLVGSAIPIFLVFAALGHIDALTALFGAGPLLATILIVGLSACFFFLSLLALQMFQYLIPDVIPQRWIGLFSGLYFAVGSVAGYLFNRFALPLVERDIRLPYVGIGAFYVIAVILLVAFVREGSYSVVAEEPGRSLRDRATAFLRLCVSRPVYPYIFLCSTLFWCAYIPFNTYFIFFAVDLPGATKPSALHLDLASFAAIRSDTFVPKTIAALLLGALIQPRNAPPLLLGSLALLALVFASGLVLVTDGTSLWWWWNLLEVLAVSFTVCFTSLLAFVFPRESYGSLFAANQVAFCAGMTVAPLASGALLDASGSYSLIFVWTGLLVAFSALSAGLIWRELRRG